MGKLVFKVGGFSRSKRNMHSEEDLQAACVDWFRMTYPDKIIFAIPNGGKRNAREAARLKRGGVLAGVSDLFIPEAGNSILGEDYCHGLWVELKINPNKLTKSQFDFFKAMKSRGYDTECCETINEFKYAIGFYFKGDSE